MAIRFAVATGNWSSTATWNGGTLPTSADDVYSNTFTVTIDTSPTVLSVSNAAASGVTAGGTFVPTNGITLTCTAATGVQNGTNVTVFASSLTVGQSCSIVANIAGGTINNINTCTNTSTGTLNITGNLTGSTGASAHTVANSSSGTLNVTGNVTGGSNSGVGVLNSSTGIVNITGNTTGGGGTGGYAFTNSSTGTVTHVGTVQASGSASGIGPGVATQTTILSGPFLTSSNGVNPVAALRWFWANSSVSSTFYQIRTQNLATIRPLYTADSVGGNPAVGNVRSGTVYGPANELTGTCAVPGAASVVVGVPVDNTTGTAAVTAATIRAAVGLASANLDTQLAAIPTTAAPTAATIASTVWGAATRTLTTTIPSASDVATAVWAAGSRTLTTTIASASDIASAVWNALTTNFNINGSFGAKILIASNTQREVAVTGSHHVAADIHELQPTVINASHFATGALDGVRTSIGMASANLDTQLANLPTASENASAVRTELSTELNRLDVNVSSRLADADYQLPLDASGTRSALGMASANLDNQLDNIPTATENASATRTELSTELGRIDAAISTRLADNNYTAPPTASDNSEAVWTYGSRTITGGSVDTLVNSPDVPTETEIAQAVRTELNPELGYIDVSISSRLADSDYQLPLDASSTRSALGMANANLDDQLSNLPTASENASTTRAELSTELSRIDTAISTRLADSDYVTPPTSSDNATATWNATTRTITGGTVDTLTNSPDVPSPEEIASQVRTEISAELSRVSNTATTQEVADIIEGALSSNEG